MCAFGWDHEKLLKLVDLYRERPELWDPTDNNYHIKKKKAEAWTLIANEIGCESAELKVKMASLLSSYRREKMKTKKSIAVTERPEEIYQSRWFAYKSFDFLQDRAPIHPNNFVVNEKATQDGSGENNETPIAHHSRHESTLQNEDEPSTKSFYSSKKYSMKKEHPIIDPIQNECIKFGDFIAAKLQKFSDEERSILMQQINNFVYEAETEMYSQQHYNHNSASSNPSSPSALPYCEDQSDPETPIPSSLVQSQLMEHSPSNCNSPQ